MACHEPGLKQQSLGQKMSVGKCRLLVVTALDVHHRQVSFCCVPVTLRVSKVAISVRVRDGFRFSGRVENDMISGERQMAEGC